MPKAEQRLFVFVHLNIWKKMVGKGHFRLDFFFLEREKTLKNISFWS